ncbi:MAG: hypothetical protein IPL88_13725 [Rhizobiales bacterium]|nr:hypothetical protein [Hyphomicrobiales bacterium]
MSGLPISLIWFVLSGFIVLLTVLPYTGDILMWLLGGFWIVFTLNAGFVSLAIEAVIGRIARTWLLAPLLWFGGYALLYAAGQMNIRRLETLAQDNARQALPFDPDADSLVVAEGASEEFGAAELARRLRAPKVYETFSERRPGGAQTLHRRWRMADDSVCARMQSDWERLRPTGAQYMRNAKDGACLYGVVEAPTGRIVRIAAQKGAASDWGVQGEQIRIDLVAAGGRASVRVVEAAALPPYPLPMSFCNHARRPVKCEFGFLATSPRSIFGAKDLTDAFDLAARALRLSRPVGTETTPAREPDAVAIEELMTTRAPDPGLPIDELLRTPAALSPYADRLAAAAAAAARDPQNLNGPTIQRLIAALPEADFRRVAPKLMQDFADATRAPGQRYPHDAGLLLRLGALGPSAAPFLGRMYWGTPGAFAAIEALCRMGTPAAAEVEQILTKYIGMGDLVALRPARRKLLVLAALRSGQPDLADRFDAQLRKWPKYTWPPDKTGLADNWAAEYAGWRGGVTPASPAQLCAVAHRDID